ncbi:MAG: LamG-like jellyroll fold domain-containing protein [bacterium]|jgi:hypothetical protein
MKKIICLFVLSVFINVVNTNAQNLVAYYKLDGNANAFIGNINGITFGSVIADTNRFNLPNASLRIQNSSSYARIPNSFDLVEKTFNFWFRLDTILSSSAPNLLTIDNGSLNHGMIYLQLYRSLGNNKLQFFGGNTNPLETNIITKKWYKISLTYKNSVYKLYLDNKLIGSVTSTNVHSIDGYQGMVLGSNRAFNSLSTLRGKIDDLSIYNYAMDSTQLANITEATCDFNNIINIYDTTNVTIVDTNYVTITDTTYLTITDTNFVTIRDTTYLSVYDTLIIDIFSSISQNPINTIKVYPNPTKDFLNINNGNFTTINNYQYVIINSSGANIFTDIVSAAQTVINISTWPEGIYFLNIYDLTGKLIEVKKIILN